MPLGDLLCLLLSQRFSISMTVSSRCVYHVAVCLLFQPGQQPDNVFCYPRILHTRMLAAVAPATEHMIVVAAQRRKDLCSSFPSLRSCSVTVDIYTTSVSHETLDESPMAYKLMDSILEQIGPTVDIIEHILPLYNFKAGE